MVKVNVKLSASFQGDRFKIVELPYNTPLSELSNYLIKSGLNMEVRDNLKHMTITSFNYIVNSQLIPPNLHGTYLLKDGDNIVILMPLAGG